MRDINELEFNKSTNKGMVNSINECIECIIELQSLVHDTDKRLAKLEGTKTLKTSRKQLTNKK